MHWCLTWVTGASRYCVLYVLAFFDLMHIAQVPFCVAVLANIKCLISARACWYLFNIAIICTIVLLVIHICSVSQHWMFLVMQQLWNSCLSEQCNVLVFIWVCVTFCFKDFSEVMNFCKTVQMDIVKKLERNTWLVFFCSFEIERQHCTD